MTDQFMLGMSSKLRSSSQRETRSESLCLLRVSPTLLTAKGQSSSLVQGRVCSVAARSASSLATERRRQLLNAWISSAAHYNGLTNGRCLGPMLMARAADGKSRSCESCTDEERNLAEKGDGEKP